ncbi:MAG TPA: hypothetical protein VJ464_14440 [Blastocatellia bacterium]|jgi:hypothetical protein|nr:hypothetical protein [Blastocatellia bacterium]
MTLEVKPLAEITHEAISVLCKHFGAANTVRFINQFTKGYGNYTEERQEIYSNMSLEEIVAEIEAKRNQP